MSFKEITRQDIYVYFQSEKQNCTWMKVNGKDYPRRTGQRAISLNTFILL